MKADGTDTKVAIIGGGASGLSAAWAFHNTEGFDFTVYEKDDRLGGHAHTFYYKGKKGTTPVDLGFIFGNKFAYSNMCELMDKTGSKLVQSDLALSVDVRGSKWATDGDGFTRKNENGKHWERQKTLMNDAGFKECTRFHNLCERYYTHATWNPIPFGWWLTIHGFNEDFKDLYLTPTLVEESYQNH